jgi:protein-disulfide reductase (glutathione)
MAAVGAATGGSPALADMKSVSPGWNNAAIAWRDYATGSAEALSSGRPMLVVAHTTWCPHCEAYKKLFFDPKTVELTKNFVMVMIDRDVEKALNAKIGPGDQMYVPRTVFLSPGGKARTDIVGSNRQYPNYVNYNGPAELWRLMKAAQVVK